MTRIYEEEDYAKALKLKRTLLYIYFGVLAVFLAVNVVFFVLFKESLLSLGGIPSEDQAAGSTA